METVYLLIKQSNNHDEAIAAFKKKSNAESQAFKRSTNKVKYLVIAMTLE